MLIVRGVNLFPTAVEDIVRSFPGTTTEYVLVIDDTMKDANGFLTGLKLRVERTPAPRILPTRSSRACASARRCVLRSKCCRPARCRAPCTRPSVSCGSDALRTKSSQASALVNAPSPCKSGARAQ